MDNINKNTSNNQMADVEMRKLDNREKTMNSLKAFARVNKGKLIGLLLAFITLVCLFNFGLFRTLGIWVVMAVGFVVGAYFDRDVRVLRILRKILN